jgi:hypothetical protein
MARASSPTPRIHGQKGKIALGDRDPEPRPRLILFPRINFVYKMCAFLPAPDLLTALLPDTAGLQPDKFQDHWAARFSSQHSQVKALR